MRTGPASARRQRAWHVEPKGVDEGEHRFGTDDERQGVCDALDVILGLLTVSAFPAPSAPCIHEGSPSPDRLEGHRAGTDDAHG